MKNNNEIINNIREIYRTAPANKIHQLISIHFIPSKEEKKNNAEIPTPLELVYEMLNKMPDDFWQTPKKVFEPCCGGYLKPTICKNCNITESKFYIKTNNNDAKLLLNLLNSDNIVKYIELCKYSGFNSRPVLENISYTNLTDFLNNPKHLIKEVSQQNIKLCKTNNSQDNFICDNKTIVETKKIKKFIVNKNI